MLSWVNAPPLWSRTRAPFCRQREASGMSDAITMSSGPACSTIQSSAASNRSPTTTSEIRSSSGTRMRALATTVTARPCLRATR